MSLGTAAQLNYGWAEPGPEPSPSRKIVPNQCAQLGLPYRRTSHQYKSHKTDFGNDNHNDFVSPEISHFLYSSQSTAPGGASVECS